MPGLAKTSPRMKSTRVLWACRCYRCGPYGQSSRGVSRGGGSPQSTGAPRVPWPHCSTTASRWASPTWTCSRANMVLMRTATAEHRWLAAPPWRLSWWARALPLACTRAHVVSAHKRRHTHTPAPVRSLHLQFFGCKPPVQFPLGHARAGQCVGRKEESDGIVWPLQSGEKPGWVDCGDTSSYAPPSASPSSSSGAPPPSVGKQQLPPSSGRGKQAGSEERKSTRGTNLAHLGSTAKHLEHHPTTGRRGPWWLARWSMSAGALQRPHERLPRVLTGTALQARRWSPPAVRSRGA